MIGIQPQCCSCRHLIEEKGHPCCTAFPKGIPDVILGGDHNHKKPYPGDNGILFSPKPKTP